MHWVMFIAVTVLHCHYHFFLEMAKKLAGKKITNVRLVDHVSGTTETKNKTHAVITQFIKIFD
jgi:hypothetical protein